MGIFDGNAKQLEGLKDNIEKLWDKVSNLEKFDKSLEKEIKTRTSDTEREAKEHSKKAAEYRNKTKNRLNDASAYIESIKSELESIREIKNSINDLSSEATSDRAEINETLSKLENAKVDLENKLSLINSKVSSIDSIFNKYPDLDNQIEKLINQSDLAEENSKKTVVSLSAINKRKEEIDDIHREIFGYKETNEESGEEVFVNGLKIELEESYEQLDKKIEESQERTEKINNKYKEKYEEFENQFKKQYQKINKDIAALLPNALTAGLSSAFSKKKDDEEKSSKEFQKRFNIGIALLIFASLLPIIISIVFINQNVELEEVIRRVPRIVLAIIPLYIPILWFTYSANKKLNLSKRLIEEYSHKEVLSRTYEGLSKQIENIEDPEQSEELRFRLLSNFLQVSSENPGKLISNYEASDHPVMEALEQTYKFQIAVDKLEGIPGMSKIAAFLEKKAKRKIKEKSDKINDALEDNSDDGSDGKN